jgi:Protein of unknown function (DUF3021)
VELFLRGLSRGAILFGVLLLISLWYKVQGQSDDSSAYFLYSIVFFFFGLASVIYQIEQWSFSKQIVAHYLAMLITVFPTMLLSGFYPVDSFKDVFNAYLQFNKAGITIFAISYFLSYFISRNNSKNSTTI